MTSLSWQIFAAVQVITRLQRQVCEIALNQRAAHPRDLLEIVNGFKGAILFAIADDGLRFFEPHAIHHPGQIFRRGSIDTDPRTLVLGRFGAGRRVGFNMTLRRRIRLVLYSLCFSGGGCSQRSRTHPGSGNRQGN